MSVSHVLSYGLNDGTTTSGSVTVSVGAQIRIDEAIPAEATAQLVALALDVSQMTYCYISCDKEVTLKTNSSGSPANTIVIEANKPLVWRSGGTGHPANPFTTDVTGLYVANVALAVANLVCRFGFDPTV